jgi:predicted RNA-binding protein YlxR (DUF448 family)
VVTRRVLPVAALIRFVLAPDGAVVADLRRRLPGRGVWVTAKRDQVALAERKKLFARGFGEAVHVAPGLADRVAEGLTAAALSALSLARKAGSVVVGFAKVEAAFGREPVIGLVHAREAGADGIEKLAAAARRHSVEPVIIRSFTGEQLDLAFGRPNVVHAALLAGPASDNMLTRVRALTDFLGENGADRPLTDPFEMSAEP